MLTMCLAGQVSHVQVLQQVEVFVQVQMPVQARVHVQVRVQEHVPDRCRQVLRGAGENAQEYSGRCTCLDEKVDPELEDAGPHVFSLLENRGSSLRPLFSL